MAEFKSRRHRLEIPSTPTSDDPAVLKKALDQMKRLVQDEFNRLSTDFYDFKKATFDAGIIPLRGVANIAVTSTEYGMTATWELPDGDEITPTHIRVRILEISPNSWATYSYPKTSWEFNGLTPGTQYTLQIQLIATFEATDTFISTTRNCPSVPVLRTAESDIKARVFTTDTGVGPPTDAGTNNENVIFVFPDTDGTPGTAGGTDCYWGYKFQYRTACAWADTAVSEVEVDGNVGNVTINTAAVPFTTYPNTLFRLAYREICNAVPGDWVYGEPFMAVDFSNTDCLGIVKSASLTAPVYSTADLFALPSVCQDDGTFLQIVDALTDTEFLPNEPGFKCIEYIDNEWTLIADDTEDPLISNVIFTGLLSGELATVGALTSTSDFSLSFDIKVPDNALVLNGGTGGYGIIKLGGKIQAVIIQNTAEYSMQINVPRDGGGSYVFRASGLNYGEWVNFFYTHDTSEADGRILYVNGVEDERSTNAILNDFDGIDNTVQINTVNNMQIRAIYGWGRAVTAAEINTINGILTGLVGYVMGGAGTVVIDKITFATDALTSGVANLGAISGDLCGFANGGVAGYAAGFGTSSTTVERFDIPAETVSTLASGLSAGRGRSAGFFNRAVAGYVAGGTTPETTTVDKYAFPAETRSTLGTGLPVAIQQGSGISNSGVAGYVAGATIGASRQDDIRKFAYPSDTASTIAAVLSSARSAMGIVDDEGTAGYMCGGLVTATNVIDKLTFATETRSTLGAVLTATRASTCGLSNPGVSGYICGGSTGSEPRRADKLNLPAETITGLGAVYFGNPHQGSAPVSDVF